MWTGRGLPTDDTISDVSPTLRRLVPTPTVDPGAHGGGATTATTIADAYDVDRPRPPDRPWVSVCMVTSLDGSVALEGTSGGLGNEHDREVLITMRRLADVVLVGAGTARGEGYGPPKQPGLRVGVATNSGHIDLDAPLFASGAGFVLAPASADVDDARVDVLRAGVDRLDLADAVGRLHEIVPDVRHAHAEGGPSLNGALLDADLVDELTLSLSPRLVGGDGPRLSTGAAEGDRQYRLAHLLTDDEDFLFARYVRR
jgi:riboflavin biosynthesis pyrimidine reductase